MLGAPTAVGASDPWAAEAARCAPLVDLKVLGPILELTGVDRLRPAVDAFWGCAFDLVAQLARAAADGDGAIVKRCAHSIKGSAANIGAARIAQIAKQIERQGATVELISELELAVEATRDALGVVFAPKRRAAPD